MRFSTGVAVLAMGLTLASAGCSSGKSMAPVMASESSAQKEFHDAMRTLWEDHIMWTRLYIISATGNLPDLAATTQRLLQNQTDIGNAIKPFYGDAAGNQLTGLLRSHILVAADLVAAAKAGNQSATTDASARWYANADSIATFLSTANPSNWKLADMKSMMKQHLDMTLEEAVDRLHANYTAEIAAYDHVRDEILQMADMLSDGIIAQFPSKLP